MTVTRRTLLLHGAALGTVLAVPGVARGAALAAAPAAAPDLPYALATWQRLSGSTVRVADAAGAVLRVTSVRDLAGVTRGNRVPGRGETFAIGFTGQSGPELTEGIHTIEHPVFGRQALFLRPCDPAGPLYQAVVNSWLPDSGSSKGSHHGGSVPR